MQLLEAENDDDVKLCFAIEEGQTLLLETGFRKGLSKLMLTDVPTILDALLDYHLIIRVKAELDQFIEGLNTLGFLQDLRTNPSLWKPYFIHVDEELTSGEMIIAIIMISQLYGGLCNLQA